MPYVKSSLKAHLVMHLIMVIFRRVSRLGDVDATRFVGRLSPGMTARFR